MWFLVLPNRFASFNGEKHRLIGLGSCQRCLADWEGVLVGSTVSTHYATVVFWRSCVVVFRSRFYLTRHLGGAGNVVP